ncbi:MAG: hypothetical protein PHV82_13880, partial [Victivallaceae bacterium]|nr:hypothetical protein [Victivallaceae bacterium]
MIKQRDIWGIVFALMLLVIISNGYGMDYEAYLYEQGFEAGGDPVLLWTADGDYTINEKGISTTKVFSGEHSYVIDITFNSATYVYWKIPQPAVPCENILNFSGRIFVEQVVGTTCSAGIGVNAYYPPTTISGCKAFGSSKYANWKLHAGNVAEWGKDSTDRGIRKNTWGATGDNAGTKIDKIVIFTYGHAGDRLRIYLDDIKLEGTVPTTASYETEISGRWADYEIKFDD